MKNALILSGGGSKGAFEVGAVKYWFEQGIEFDVIAGTSVGSLNGAMIAQNKFDELLHVWNNISDDQIYKKYSYLGIAIRLIMGKKSAYDATPLLGLIQRHVKKADFVKPFHMGITSLNDGNYHSVTVDQLETDEDVQSAVFASSLMPVLWTPVEVKTASGVLHNCVDGGLRNVTPLADVLSTMPDHVYIVSCNNLSGKEEPAEPKTIIDIIKRTVLDIFLGEIIKTDVSEYLRINDLVLQAKEKGFVLHNKNGKEYKYFETTIVQPDRVLANPIDFSEDLVQKNMKYGYELASQTK